MGGQNIIHGWSEYYTWVVRILYMIFQNTLPPSLCSSASCKEHFFQPDLQNMQILTKIQNMSILANITNMRVLQEGIWRLVSCLNEALTSWQWHIWSIDKTRKYWLFAQRNVKTDNIRVHWKIIMSNLKQMCRKIKGGLVLWFCNLYIWRDHHMT